MQKTALITGANKGIGLAVARELARQNFHVLLGARDEFRGGQAAQQLQNEGLNVQFLPLDVTGDASTQDAVRRVEREFDALDVLVNNAAINLDRGPANVDRGRSILEITPDEFRQTFETNVLGALRVTQGFWPLLLQSDSPRVINVSSGLGSLSGMKHEMPAYSTSKSALNALTRQFAGLGQGKVSVNTIDPGWVITDMGGAGAYRTPAQGAAIIVKLATMDAPPSRQFLRDGGEIGW